MALYLDLNESFSSSDEDNEYVLESPESSYDEEEPFIHTLRPRINRSTSNSENTATECIEPNDTTNTVTKIKTTKPKPKKRQKNPQKWKRNVTKKRVNSKQSHITSTFEITAESRVCGQCSCSYECWRRINEAEQKNIHDLYAGLGDRNKQIHWVNQNSLEVDPVYRYPLDVAGRQLNRKYFLPIDGIQVRVCKIFFMNTLDVGNTFLRNAFANFDETTGQIETDGRGKHDNRKKVSEEDKEEVRNHIKSFPRIESHYLRAQTTREFLEGNLNLTIMYRLYGKEMALKGRTPVKFHTYSQIFNNEFNIGFFKPKKDQCDLCVTWNHLDESEQSSNVNLKQKYDNHITNKALSRKEKETDILYGKNPQNETIVCCYDLQAIMQSPCGDVSSFFYKSKLNCYNFTIFDCSNDIGYCYFWNEAMAFKGANEVSTFVSFFLRHHVGKKNFVFYSDNCSSQNKNRAILSMYFWAVQQFDIEKITHKYLVKGHTQMQADSMHSCIERNKKLYLQANNIYVPADWLAIIRTAKRTGSPFQVYESIGDEFLDFKKFSDHFNFKDFPFMDVKVLEVRKNDSNVYFKTDYAAEFRSVSVTKRTVEYSEISPRAAASKSSISSAKKKDLKEMCESGVIPQRHHYFYENLTAGTVQQIEEAAEEATEDMTIVNVQLDIEF